MHCYQAFTEVSLIITRRRYALGSNPNPTDSDSQSCINVDVQNYGFIFCPSLKVPKREIFDRSDFSDFYTIKSLRVGDFGVKIKKNVKQ